MKNLKSKIGVMLVLILLNSLVFSNVQIQNVKAEIIENKFEYVINEDKSITIVSYKGNEKSVIVPEEIDGKKVITIGAEAFKECYRIESITLPNSITLIGERAFENCLSLKTIKLNNNIRLIGDKAFMQCKSLESIVLPEKLDRLSDSLFYGCTKLTSIVLPNELNVIGNSVFALCKSITEINIPGSVSIIGSYAFANCTSLSRISIPKDITIISSFMFQNCENLKEVFLGYNAKKIDSKTFVGCNNLLNIYIPSTVEKIEIDAIEKNNNLSITGLNNSFAKDYAEKNEINFQIVKELQINSCTMSKKSPQLLGNSIDFTGVKDGGVGEVLYNYSVMKNNQIITESGFSTNNKFNWKPESVGDYIINLQVKDSTGRIVECSKNYKIYEKLKIQGAEFNKVSPQLIGTEVQLSFKTSGGLGNVKYRYVVIKDGINLYNRPYSANNSALWTPTEAGIYTVYFQVKDETNEVLQEVMTYEIKDFLDIKELTTIEVEPKFENQPINFKANTIGGIGTIEYRFVVMKDGNNIFTRKYMEKDTFTWTPTEKGIYDVICKVKDGTGKEISKTIKYEVYRSGEIVFNDFTTSLKSPQAIGSNVLLQSKAYSNENLYYRFVAIKDGKVEFVRVYKESNEIIWTPASAGNYIIYFKVKNDSGLELTKTLNYIIE